MAAKRPEGGRVLQVHGLTQSDFYLWRKRMAGPGSTDTSSAGESEWHLLSRQPSTLGWEVELALPGEKRKTPNSRNGIFTNETGRRRTRITQFLQQG